MPAVDIIAGLDFPVGFVPLGGTLGYGDTARRRVFDEIFNYRLYHPQVGDKREGVLFALEIRRKPRTAVGSLLGKPDHADDVGFNNDPVVLLDDIFQAPRGGVAVQCEPHDFPDLPVGEPGRIQRGRVLQPRFIRCGDGHQRLVVIRIVWRGMDFFFMCHAFQTDTGGNRSGCGLSDKITAFHLCCPPEIFPNGFMSFIIPIFPISKS
ncbi:hypothetical protein ES705_15416 [subsurface metagenome]